MVEQAVVKFDSKSSRKNIRSMIEEKLTLSLADYRSIVGDKKFESRIRKTARRIGEDIVKALPKKPKK